MVCLATVNLDENKSKVLSQLRYQRKDFNNGSFGGATTFSITTFSITTLSLTTFSITTLSIKGLIETLRINDTRSLPLERSPVRGVITLEEQKAISILPQLRPLKQLNYRPIVGTEKWQRS